MLRMTIFAARRVLPPLLIAPANASKPRMNAPGPDAVPPPLSSSRELRRLDRFEPVPEPYLNNMPSVFAKPRIELIESSTELMKHAEHCGFSSTPTLNQTGELNAIFWCRSRWTSSSRNAHASCSVLKYASALPQP